MNKCLCGCGQSVPTTSNYRPGHDARHAGRIAKEALAAYQTKSVSDWSTVINTSKLPSAALKMKATDIVIHRLARDTKAPKTEEVPVREVVKSTVKVGRWEYPAYTEDGETFRNTKRDGSGEWVAA